MTSKQNPAIGHITPAGGNIFEDIGFAPQEAARLKIKSQLMMELEQWISQQKLTQKQAADLLGVTRPRISDVVTGKIDKFTIDALVEMLEHAGKHVSVKVA